MSIRTKIFVGLGLMVLFFVAQALAVWLYSSHTRNQVVSVISMNTTTNQKLEEVALLAQQIRRYEKEYFIYVNDATQREKYQQEWADAHAEMTQKLVALAANRSSLGSRVSLLGADDLKEVAAWREASDFYGAEMTKIFDGVQKQATRSALQADQPPVRSTPPRSTVASARAKIGLPS
jgi:hypothetical protein